MVAEQVSSTLNCLCGTLEVMSNLRCIASCWRLIVSVMLYVGYVYAGFFAMACLAYNAFVEANERIGLIFIVVAIPFLLLGIVVVTLLEWIWKSWMPAQQQQDPTIYHHHQPMMIRVLMPLLVWGMCFYVSTYVLWWLAGHNDDNNINLVVMWILLATLVPIMDLFNSRRVRQAIPWPNFWGCCGRNDGSTADGGESDDQQAESLVVV